ncbi:metallopeptidase family protein [Trueperella sp. LYQ143]|uniref:metallopeptidase family protein n=1 Tax=unclassified Trueperella TaxID=2630174 RepID=UPI0039835404
MQIIPRRAHARRRDRHGRGIPGPILPMSVPAWRTRADCFDDLIAWDLGTFRRHLGERMDHIDFAVMDAPQNDPAPWEESVPLARYLPFERPARIHGRIIFYRMPILHAMRDEDDPRLFIHSIVVSQLASALNVDPDEIDYL